MRQTGSRIWSLVLLVVFVGGGLGLPDADALLFHALSADSRSDVAHVEPPGGCGAHSEQCALSAAASPPQLAVAGPGLERAIRHAALDHVFASVPSLASADRSFLYPSRAPPHPAC